MIALYAEKRKDFISATESYNQCMNECNNIITQFVAIESNNNSVNIKYQKFIKELRGEIMLRLAIIKKEMSLFDQALQICNTITTEQFSDSIKANTLCLKVILKNIYYLYIKIYIFQLFCEFQ